MLAPWKKNYDKHSILKSSGIALLTKVRLIKAMVFPVAMYGCESWTIKKAECWRIDAMVLWCWRKLLRVPWTARRSNQSVKGNTTWILIGKTDAEAQSPILWLPDMKSWLTGQDPDAGKDWRQEEKGTTEDETVGWHHWLYGHEFEQAVGVGDGQGSLTCCSLWGHKESDMTERLNWTELIDVYLDCFNILAITIAKILAIVISHCNNAAIKLVFLFSLEKYLEMGLLGHMAVLSLIFWGNFICFP